MMRKQNKEVKKKIERLRQEFENKEKKWEEEKNNMSERVARLEYSGNRKLKNL
jgi:hypothetical protein